jgi:hypothetical protein
MRWLANTPAGLPLVLDLISLTGLPHVGSPRQVDPYLCIGDGSVTVEKFFAPASKSPVVSMLGTLACSFDSNSNLQETP